MRNDARHDGLMTQHVSPANQTACGPDQHGAMMRGALAALMASDWPSLGGAHRIQEFADFEFQPVAVARQRFGRRQHLG